MYAYAKTWSKTVYFWYIIVKVKKKIGNGGFFSYFTSYLGHSGGQNNPGHRKLK